MSPVDSAIQLLNNWGLAFLTQNLPNTVERTKEQGPNHYTVQFSGSLRHTNLPSMLWRRNMLERFLGGCQVAIV